jgi:hypothetical protein
MTTGFAGAGAGSGTGVAGAAGASGFVGGLTGVSWWPDKIKDEKSNRETIFIRTLICAGLSSKTELF